MIISNSNSQNTVLTCFSPHSPKTKQKNSRLTDEFKCIKLNQFPFKSNHISWSHKAVHLTWITQAFRCLWRILCPYVLGTSWMTLLCQNRWTLIPVKTTHNENLPKSKKEHWFKYYQIHKSHLKLPLQVSPHLNVFYGAFASQPLLNLVKGSVKRKTFLD